MTASFERGDDCNCPNCRGPGTVKPLFRHLGTTTPEDTRESAVRASWVTQTEARSEERPSETASQHSAPAHTFLTAEELSEWSSSYSALPPDEYITHKYGGPREHSRDHVTTNVHIKQTSQTKLPGAAIQSWLTLGAESISLDARPRKNLLWRQNETGIRLPTSSGNTASMSMA